MSADGLLGADPVAAPRTEAPDFYIVGHPKSGTTAMYEMLRSHPGVFMPDFKEPRYFARDLPSRFQEPRRSGLPAETYEDYLALFSGARPDQRVGEASTAYIWSTAAAGEIAKVRPDARVIALFREPASFLRSMHMQLLEIRVEHCTTLRGALDLEDARRAGRELPEEMRLWPQVLLYRDRVRYVEQLRRYHEAFGRDQVLVLIYEDFRRDNEATMKRVLRFLDLDEDVPMEVSQANPSLHMRSVKLDGIVKTVTVGDSAAARSARRLAKRVLSPSARAKVRSALWRGLVFGSPRDPGQEVLDDLRGSFRGEVEAFSEYLGRDLVELWGYDRLT
jgi:hypothetical protein